jgi:hypothetical protein
MISESAIYAFLDRFGYIEKCKKCGIVVWRMIDKHVQPHLYTSELVEHSHEESKPHQVKKLIETERRSPGGTWRVWIV